MTHAEIAFTLNGAPARSAADGRTLLEALRDLGVHSTKDGCSPQGQCGCCTVWVDGQARVACVTPLARVAGRSVTTLEGLP
jgi:aerobic-type carbon monoxide dehydrogenase small subunit (CoxS/CutS family)